MLSGKQSPPKSLLLILEPWSDVHTKSVDVWQASCCVIFVSVLKRFLMKFCTAA